MDAPPGKEDVGPYLRVAAMLRDIGVNAPRVLERSERDGFLLLTDLGTVMYLPELAKPGQADRAVWRRVRRARARSSRGRQPCAAPAALRREAAALRDEPVSRTGCCSGTSDLSLSARESTILADAMDALVANAFEQPQVFVHRDYHSRNLMVCPENNPGILDFQDAVRGG